MWRKSAQLEFYTEFTNYTLSKVVFLKEFLLYLQQQVSITIGVLKILKTVLK